MNLLLDTHVLLWWLADDPTLEAQTRSLITNPRNRVFVSATSIWEIVIKQSLGKLRVEKDFQEVLEQQPFQFLDVTAQHAFAVRDLPPLHRDPFDRLLIAQCLHDGLIFVTRDENNLRYEMIQSVEA